jgi:hypothetical protein
MPVIAITRIIPRMTTRLVSGLCAAALLMCAPNPFAQEREDRTPLSRAQNLRAREQAGSSGLVKR